MIEQDLIEQAERGSRIFDAAEARDIVAIWGPLHTRLSTNWLSLEADAPGSSIASDTWKLLQKVDDLYMQAFTFLVTIAMKDALNHF